MELAACALLVTWPYVYLTDLEFGLEPGTTYLPLAPRGD